MNDAERINAILQHTGLNGKRFAGRIGLRSPDSIYHIQRGRNRISANMAERIVMAFPEVDKAWLMTGRGEMLLPGAAGTAGTTTDHRRLALFDPARHEAATRPAETAANLQQVPLYDFEAVAGLVPIFTNQNRPIDYISIPDLPRCDGAVYVRGDSMYPLLKSGDIVMYKQIQDYYNIIWGEMYLISFAYEGEEYITVKFIKKVDDHPDRVLLVSHNPHHAPKEIPVAAIRALALVKASIRFNTMG
mgnify:CR=1 FL=1|jgi:phage repressor protein C with HTH and peptisase S24 domain